MSRRNPQNERYTVEQEGRRAGSTAPKAGSAKPASKAAASVRIQTSKSSMSKKQKVVAQQTMTKEEKKAARAKERELENLVYTATTTLTNKDPQYKKLRKIWWGLLIAAVVFTALSWITLSTGFGGQVLSIVVLVLAYAGIIGALIMDFTVIRKRRNVFRDKVNAMTRKQVERVVEESYAERQASDAAKKARKEAKKAGKSEAEQEEAAKQAAAEVMSASSKKRAAADAAEVADAKGTVYRKAKGKGKKGVKSADKGKNVQGAAEKAGDAAGAAGTTEISEVAVADAAAEAVATSEADAAAAAEEARLEAARKAARDFANSKR